MTPLYTCGLVLAIVGTLFLLVLFIVAAIRVLRAPIHIPVPQSDANLTPVDVLVLDKQVDVSIEGIQMSQPGVLLVPGMSVLVSQEGPNDGRYLVDLDRQLVRMDCLYDDQIYTIESGKYGRTKFQPRKTAPQQHRLLKVVLTDTHSKLPLDEDVAHVVIIVSATVADVQLMGEGKCLLTIWSAQPVHILTDQDTKSIEPGVSHVLYDSGTVFSAACPLAKGECKKVLST
jgi:hypothetical protein